MLYMILLDNSNEQECCGHFLRWLMEALVILWLDLNAFVRGVDAFWEVFLDFQPLPSAWTSTVCVMYTLSLTYYV